MPAKHKSKPEKVGDKIENLIADREFQISKKSQCFNEFLRTKIPAVYCHFDEATPRIICLPAKHKV
ncbi:MAG: hypothetical protein A2306_10485 [Omnitrophica WOR_2 bacterium RIFOXYB2_FULL_38_16]|nr:MAG: hypothetical protein A2243_04645 [Omnitrophica WOR_2 bacterium RIFOXYA2_FULL_38_17]OGX53252.1 MAG: hypothetical protein A2267_03585 [Omnitrophica WOR_2 bacterium RIFOXYA12_FULL_38_10]OGX58671.1 MAG: hypothetical protein A2306_10485 [Omnitrophica WOR_2 bacterium RIFOXYB2_FULL_38_16]HBG62325.1 hypothetical protein [Candidatus Omnitrophota bacterium]